METGKDTSPQMLLKICEIKGGSHQVNHLVCYIIKIFSWQFRAVSGYLSGCNLNWMTISISHSLRYRLVPIVHLSSFQLHSSDLQNIDRFNVRRNEMHENSFKNDLYGHRTMVSKLVLQTITNWLF